MPEGRRVKENMDNGWTGLGRFARSDLCPAP